MERTVPFLNACVSFVVFITTITLVIYMLIAFVAGVFDVAQLMKDTVLLDPSDRQLIFKSLNSDFLHNIAILLILMKAYRILVEYMRFHHIDLKFMVEITIIACVLELLFNFQHYTPDMRLVLLGLGVTFLGVYAFRYDILVRSSESTQQRKQLPSIEPGHVPEALTRVEVPTPRAKVVKATKAAAPKRRATTTKTR